MNCEEMYVYVYVNYSKSISYTSIRVHMSYSNKSNSTCAEKKSVKMSKLSCKEMILHHSMNKKWCNVNVFRALETQLVFVKEKGDYDIEVLSRVLFIPWNGLILLSVFSMWV